MGNEYKVTEDGIIKCVCGGTVTLKSTNKNMHVAGVKPLHIQDILNAPITGCPSKHPCTKVASINSSGTIKKETGSDNKTFLYRIDCFLTDQGKKLILDTPGQSAVKGSQTVSQENEKSHYIKNIEKTEEDSEENSCKYRLHLLRQTSTIDNNKNIITIYKPIRASRNFIKSTDTFKPNIDEIEYDNIRSQMLSFVYILKDDAKDNAIENSYQVFTVGAIDSYKLEDVRYRNLKTLKTLKYIPLKDDKTYQIYYSNIELTTTEEIRKLNDFKLELNPKSLTENISTYVSDIQNSSLNSFEIKKDSFLTTQVEGNLKYYDIVGILKDSIGEIDDLYDKYYTNYKLAHSYNSEVIKNIKENNSYAYTIANLVDYCYVPNTEEYNKNVDDLKTQYMAILYYLFYNKEILEKIIKDNTSAENLIKKDDEKSETNKKIKIGKSYIAQLKMIKRDFFTYNRLVGWIIDIALIGIEEYIPTYRRCIFLYSSIRNSGNINTKDLEEELANIVFILLYNENFNADLKKFPNYDEIDKLREELHTTINNTEPKPPIEDINALTESGYWRRLNDETQPIYSDILNKKDSFLEEYDNLTILAKKVSFELSSEIKLKSKYLYKDDKDDKVTYYSNDSLLSPKKILIKIKEKLKSNELKKLLIAYSNITDLSTLYVVSCMNIVLLLSSPRVNIDEEIDAISFFNEDLDHIYNFALKLKESRLELGDDINLELALDYNVAFYYSKMLRGVILNYLFQKESKKDYFKKVIKFLDTELEEITSDSSNFHTKLKEEEDKKNKAIDSLSKIEGFSSKIGTILDEYRKSEKYKYKEIQQKLNKLSSGLKGFSNIVVALRMYDFVFSDNEKAFVDYMSFANDVVQTSELLSLFIINNTNIKLLTSNFLKNKIFSSLHNSSKKYMTKFIKGSLPKLAFRFNIITIIIITAYESPELLEKEDYDALAMTLLTAFFSIVFVIAVALSSGFVMIASTILGLVSLISGVYLLDSDLTVYLRKSLLYRNGDYNLRFINELAGQSKKLGLPKEFDKPKDLIKFIGSNYQANKEFFDTALANELSFFRTELSGIKLSFEDVEKNIYGVQYNEAIKIPNSLAEDEEFKIYLSIGEKEYITIDKKSLPLKSNYFKFIDIPTFQDILNQEPFMLNQTEPLKKEDFILDIFTNKDILNQTDIVSLLNSREIFSKKAYIIITSSQINLKYEFDISLGFIFKSISLDNLEQISFSLDDQEILNKEENKND